MAAAGLALVASTFSPAVAQSSNQGGPMMGMMGEGMTGRGMIGGGMMGGRQAKMGAMADGRLAYLKGELAITDAQFEA